METINNWLILQPKHIDENFDRFLAYFKSHSSTDHQNDTLYENTLKLLEQRIEILFQERLNHDSFAKYKEQKLMFDLQLCGTFLLANADNIQKTESLRKAFLIFLNNFFELYQEQINNQEIEKVHIVRFDAKILHTILFVLSNKMPLDLPFKWKDIIDFDINQMLLCLNNWIKDSQNDKLFFQQKGLLAISDGEINISLESLPSYMKMIESNSLKTKLTLEDGKINIMSTERGKMKKDKPEDIKLIKDYISYFITDMRNFKPKADKSPLKNYHIDDMLTVKITSKKYDSILVESIDPGYNKIKGKIEFENIYFFKSIYRKELFCKALNEGDYIKVKLIDDVNYSFSVKDKILSLVYYNSNYDYLVKVPRQSYSKPLKNGLFKLHSWTAEGLCVYIDVTENDIDKFKDNDNLAWIRIKNSGKDKYEGSLFGDFIEITSVEDDFDIEKGQIELIRELCVEEPIDPQKTVDQFKKIDKLIVKELCKSLVTYQRSITQSIKKYTTICFARLLAEMIEDEIDSSMLQFISEYLNQIIQFSISDSSFDYNIQLIEPNDEIKDTEIVRHSLDVLCVLQCFNKDFQSVNSTLEEYINREDDALHKGASLVQAYNRVCNMLDKSTLHNIKKEIVKSLSKIMDGEANLEMTEEFGKYGYEDDTKEFKSSFFEAPKDAKEQRQDMNIFIGICAMLNHLGGTLYLGVNDSGDPKGLDRDIAKINKMPGLFEQGLPGLMEYIKKKGENTFGEKVWSCVSMTANQEENIIEIHITPYPFDVVFLDNKPYIRKNNSSKNIMEDSTVKEKRTLKINAQKLKNPNIIPIQEAIQKQVKVKLIDYHSSNTRTIRDRIVEPFEISDDFKTVTCYEIETESNKEFRFDHMKRVSLSDEKWTAKEKHIPAKKDVFGWTFKKDAYEIEIIMNLIGKNIIEDRHPTTKNIIHKSNSNSEEWKLETTVFNLDPIARFLIAYPEDFKIASGEELINFVNELKKRFGYITTL